ncbi:MAG: DUF6383 domain-containing protein [Tannerellaceae bacterium]|nr:DUF6383 domain-containing protein [Tannerellaceae bacterium]
MEISTTQEIILFYDAEVYIYKQSYDGGSQLTVASIDLLPTQKDQNVTIGFAGYDGCNPASNKTSLDQDLYVIKNAEGKYLAIPLAQADENNIAINRAPEWVTLERNMEPWNMPAYQWVVEKTQAAAELASTSPIKITNREYGISIVRTQLYTDGPTILEGVEVKPENFIKDPANIKADPYVGYRMLDKDSLLVTGYTFRYLHQYNDEKYLGIGGIENDSVLYAEGKVKFSLDTVPVRNVQPDYRTTAGYERMTYGYVPANSRGWATLQRRSYIITVKGTADTTYVVRDKEDRYAVSSKVNRLANGNLDYGYYGRYDNIPVRFYLKENNYKDGRHYYALVDLVSDDRSFASGGSTYESRKAAVDDNSTIAKSFNLSEVRTSAFAIEIDDTPLYRRFKDDPAEGVAVRAIDTPDTMRFFEKYRKEYLQMESNPNFVVPGIDFLGIDAQSKAKGGISFHVDSAWIGRGLGYIKPQYLISIDRNDQAPVDAIPCPLDDHGIDPETGIPYDKWTCPHATQAIPGFNRGRYLINFEFPGYGVKDDAENDYVWRKFYRAGFVDAVHMGDSLFILRDEFAGLPNNRIDTAAIKAAEAAWRKADKDRTVDDYYYIVNLQGDIHKFVTWSMRYVDPNHTVTNNEFLIESMSETGTITDAIAPLMGAWLKMNNGCLVLSDRTESEFNRETAGDDALIFNVEYVDGDELATDDEVIAATSVVVIAGQGTVTVKNAAGKKVSISNILGQTVANTVVTSDNATIAVPAGVVVVAVEGEAAVKAIVK